MMEQPLKVLKPLARMPFTLAVFMRLVVLIPIFGMSVFMVITSYSKVQQGNKFEWSTLITGIVFFIISSYLLLFLFFLKKRHLSQLQYLFYADRLVIRNQAKEQVLHEIAYSDFPEFSFHENLNNFGYIVIGPQEPIFAKHGIFNQKVGVSMKDPDVMLENLPEVKKEYLFLKELIEAYREKHHTFSWEL